MHHLRPLHMLAVAVVVVVAAAAGCGGSQHPREAAIERWAENHPAASRDLGVWVRSHPQAAAVFFEWDAQHPAGAQEFVVWTVNHPAQPLEGFLSTHPRWQGFEVITETHRPAAMTFMDWCRRHPPAANALMHHPGGLAWAGHHIYQADWHLEKQ